MKRIVALAAGLLMVLALASCYWRPDFSSGGLNLDVSGITAKAEGDVIRVYLIADGLLFSTGGGVPFSAEVPLTTTYGQEQVVTISGLPVGPTYKAMIGMGPVTGGIFYPTNYGESAEFTVNPNADTPISVDLNNGVPFQGNITFAPNLLGRKLVGVVDEDYGSMYAAESGTLHYVSLDPFSYPYVWTLMESGGLSYQVQGLSRGTPIGGFVGTYLSTASGILPFLNSVGWAVDNTFSAMLGGSRDIREADSFYFYTGLPPDYAAYPVFFRRENGLGGTYVLPSATVPTSWSWVNLELAGVTDLDVSNYNAYYAAGGNAFALPPVFLQDASPNLAARRIDIASPATVLSVGFRPGDGTLTLGTANGVWKVQMSESPTSPYATVASAASQPAPFDLTAGDRIERIAISSYESYNEAYFSRYYLYIRYLYGLERIPFFAVMPGRATGMAWDSNGTLFISGTEGLAAVYVGNYSAC